MNLLRRTIKRLLDIKSPSDELLRFAAGEPSAFDEIARKLDDETCQERVSPDGVHNVRCTAARGHAGPHQGWTAGGYVLGEAIEWEGAA